MATDDFAADILEHVATALRDFAAGCTPPELERLVHALETHGLAVDGINPIDQLPTDGDAS